MAAIDPAFGLNNFGKPKMYNESQTLANNILTVLFGKPGAYPSMPDLGMYVQELLYYHYEDFDEVELKTQLEQQCSAFDDVVSDGSFDIVKSKTSDTDGIEKPLVLFIIPTIIQNVSRRLAIGVTVTESGVAYNFAWLDE